MVRMSFVNAVRILVMSSSRNILASGVDYQKVQSVEVSFNLGHIMPTKGSTMCYKQFLQFSVETITTFKKQQKNHGKLHSTFSPLLPATFHCIL